jgi:hypothetical protein
MSATGSGGFKFCRAYADGGGGCFGSDGNMIFCFCLFSATGLDELDVDAADPNCECKASTMVSRDIEFEAEDCSKEPVLRTGLGSELPSEDAGEGEGLRRTHGTGRSRCSDRLSVALCLAPLDLDLDLERGMRHGGASICCCGAGKGTGRKRRDISMSQRKAVCFEAFDAAQIKQKGNGGRAMFVKVHGRPPKNVINHAVVEVLLF